MGKLLKELQSKHKKGFTLFEVLIVVIIMGVLATIALPTYHKVVRKSRVADGLNSLDMLAGAQEKYFMEHGFYAQNINELKAPFKESRPQDPSNPFTDIITTNFTYSKDATRNCIVARSSTGNYSLVKNYKQKGKVVCRGTGCRDITDFVETMQGNMEDLCPVENECLGNQNMCGDLHFWADKCNCRCTQNEYVQCAMQGGTLNYNDCSCSGVCESSCDSEGQVTPWVNTSEICHGPLASSKGIGPINPGVQEFIKCGIIRERKNCKHNCWLLERECIDKKLICQEQGLVLDESDCECYPPCDPAAQPQCSSTLGSYTICDPCPGGNCSHCGYKQTASASQAVCEHGVWQCQTIGSSGVCTEVTGNIPATQDCDGGYAGNTCGKKDLIDTICKQEVTGGIPELIPQYGACELKAGNECYDGQDDWGECTLSDGTAGIYHCNNCKATCIAKTCELPEPIVFIPNSNKCKKYGQKCVETSPGVFEWQNDYSLGQLWVTDYGLDENGQTLNCVSGTKTCTTADGIQGKRTCTDCKYGDCVPYCDPADKPQDTNCVTYECKYKSGNWQWSPVLLPTAQCDPNGTFNPANGITGCNPNTCQIICKGNGVYNTTSKKCYGADLQDLIAEVYRVQSNQQTNQTYIEGRIHYKTPNGQQGVTTWSDGCDCYNSNCSPVRRMSPVVANAGGAGCGPHAGSNGNSFLTCNWIEANNGWANITSDTCRNYCGSGGNGNLNKYCVSTQDSGTDFTYTQTCRYNQSQTHYWVPKKVNKVYKCVIAHD